MSSRLTKNQRWLVDGRRQEQFGREKVRSLDGLVDAADQAAATRIQAGVRCERPHSVVCTRMSIPGVKGAS